MDVGPAELLIVLVVFLVLFGSKKIPDLARSLGQAKNEFEKGVRGEGPEDEPTPVPVAEAAPIVETEAQPTTAVAAAPVETLSAKADAEA